MKVGGESKIVEKTKSKEELRRTKKEC